MKGKNPAPAAIKPTRSKVTCDIPYRLICQIFKKRRDFLKYARQRVRADKQRLEQIGGAGTTKRKLTELRREAVILLMVQREIEQLRWKAFHEHHPTIEELLLKPAE